MVYPRSGQRANDKVYDFWDNALGPERYTVASLRDQDQGPGTWDLGSPD